MSAALQVALFAASVLFVLLAACLPPVVFLIWRQLMHLSIVAERLEADLRLLMQDSRETLRNVNDFSRRANQQLDDVNKVIRIAEKWMERADRLVNEVGSSIEPPVYSAIRNVNLLRTGAAAFLNALWHHNQHNQTQKEKDHV